MKNKSFILCFTLMILCLASTTLKSQYYLDGNMDMSAHKRSDFKGVIKSSTQFQTFKKQVKFIKDVKADNILSVFAYITNTDFSSTDFTLYIYEYADSNAIYEYGGKSFIEIKYTGINHEMQEKFKQYYSSQLKEIFASAILFVDNNGADKKFVFPYKDDYVKLDETLTGNTIRIYFSKSNTIDWESLQVMLDLQNFVFNRSN